MVHQRKRAQRKRSKKFKKIRVDCSKISDARDFFRQVGVQLNLPTDSRGWDSFYDWTFGIISDPTYSGLSAPGDMIRVGIFGLAALSNRNKALAAEITRFFDYMNLQAIDREYGGPLFEVINISYIDAEL